MRGFGHRLPVQIRPFHRRARPFAQVPDTCKAHDAFQLRAGRHHVCTKGSPKPRPASHPGCRARFWVEANLIHLMFGGNDGVQSSLRAHARRRTSGCTQVRPAAVSRSKVRTSPMVEPLHGPAPTSVGAPNHRTAPLDCLHRHRRMWPRATGPLHGRRRNR
jgi:hypothetical protein